MPTDEWHEGLEEVELVVDRSNSTKQYLAFPLTPALQGAFPPDPRRAPCIHPPPFLLNRVAGSLDALFLSASLLPLLRRPLPPTRLLQP